MVEIDPLNVNSTSASTNNIEVPAEATNVLKLPEMPPKKVAQTAPPPLHLHHGLIGIGLVVTGVTFSIVAPKVKPITRMAVGLLGVVAGAALIWDDFTSHAESKCGIDTWFNFTPCPGEMAPVASIPVAVSQVATIVVKKREQPSA